jgi:hypothetical protein
MAKVLAIGLDPRAVKAESIPGFTPEVVQAYIDSQLDRVRAAGHSVESCLVFPDARAEAALLAKLRAQEFDCVLIGAGLRDAGHALLFEKLLNVIHENAARAKICFNSSPADSAEAVQRWI